MQICSINNINSNPKFGALKGLRYVGEFNPSTNFKHAEIVDAVINSEAIKKFGEKYNFIARLKHSDGYEPITMTRVFGHYYSIELIPAPVEQPQEPSLTLWERIFSRKKNNAKSKAPVEETLKEEDKIENLPIAILITNIMGRWNSDTINKFIQQIKSETLDSIEHSLQYYINKQNEEQQEKENQGQEHAHVLNEIKDAGL